MALLRVQLGLIAIRLFNIAYSCVILSSLRASLLRLCRCQVGDKVGLHDGVRFTWIGRLSVGERSTINQRCFLDARGHITIGRNTMIGRCVSLYTMSHDLYSDSFASVVAPVRIGDNVVIFPHSIVMPGVTIHSGAVVYPGSVVTSDIMEDEIVGGVPAKVLGRRSAKAFYLLDYTFFFANA